MIKKHKKFKIQTMRRSTRIFLCDLNSGKSRTLIGFLVNCHDVTQYFVDLFWQRREFDSALADRDTTHRACDRFGVSPTLSQALAKQAKEAVRRVIESAKTMNSTASKPKLRKHTTTLDQRFVRVEPFNSKAGIGFDYAVLIGRSGTPKITIPVKSTKHLNKLTRNGWAIGKTIRIGRRKDEIFIDLILEKAKPPLRSDGEIVGMDSNYKNGLVFSDGQVIGTESYKRIQTFGRRQKNTHAEIKSMLGAAIKNLDLSNAKVLVIENLRNVKSRTRGKFPRLFNRRLSHWMYSYVVSVLGRVCEESGVKLIKKDPWKTSQFCLHCHKCDRRSRRGDLFDCIFCGYEEHADLKSAIVLELLGLAGVYSLRSLKSLEMASSQP